MTSKTSKLGSEAIQAANGAQQETGASNRPGSPVIRTALLFAAFMGVFHAILWLALPEWKGNLLVQNFITSLVSPMLTIFGVVNSVHGNQINLKSNLLIVTQECTAINVLILFTSFVLAYSSTMRAKLIGLIVGIPFIFVVNIARILALGLISEYFSHRSMELFHDYIWQMAFLFLVVTMWFVWIEMVVMREKTPAVPR